MMIDTHTRTYMGGGQYAPSLDEQQDYLAFVEERVELLLALENQEQWADWGKSTFFTEDEALDVAVRLAYDKFGFCDEHFA